jgi:RimJ/RimL family protein N-acetyltransferase
MRVIEQDDLRLEPQTRAHADEMFVVLADPAIYEHENAPPASVEWLRERYARLESRRSRDGQEQWLNWVVRLEGIGLIGYVQATVRTNGSAAVAYEFASAYWGRGLAKRAVDAMIVELTQRYGVNLLMAVLKERNLRSRRLLERLEFAPATASIRDRLGVDADELLMLRDLRDD